MKFLVRLKRLVARGFSGRSLVVFLRPHYLSAALAVPAVAGLLLGGSREPARPAAPGAPRTVEVQDMKGYSLLLSTSIGAKLVSSLDATPIRVEEGSLPEHAWGSFRPSPRTVVLRQGLADDRRKAALLAGVLAHEYTHALQMRYDLPASRDKEFEAKVNECLALRELDERGRISDPLVREQLDVFEEGRRALESFVERLYPDLPWLGPRRLTSTAWGRYFREAEARYAAVWPKGRRSRPAAPEQPDLRKELERKNRQSLEELVVGL